MKLKGQLVWTDYLNAQLLHARPSGLGIIVPYGILLIIGFGFFGGLFLVATGVFPIGMMLPGFIFVVLIPLYRYVFFPKQVRKLFFQQKELNMPFEIEITDTGLIVSNELGTGTRPWANFLKWKENKDLLILYHSDVLYSILPKRMLSDSQQAEIIKTYLEKNKVSLAKNRSTSSCIIYIIFFLIIATMLYMGLSNSINQ